MAATTDLIPGDRIGNYRIEIELACDGIGVTYRALHQVLPRRAIIKVMHATSQPRVVHLLREACMLDALHHPGIIRVYEAGLLPDRRPWFACELVDGPTLQSLISPGTIDRIDAIALLRDVAGVLDHAHHRGVVHCGLRPIRILLTGPSRGYPICIADWSDARTHDASPQPYVVSPASWGYTAPELSRGDAVDDRADVFALGVIAYQLLAGMMPFEGRVATAADGTSQHVPTAVHCPELPRELTTMVDQMLAVARWDRPSSAEVYADLSWLVDALAPGTTPPTSNLRIRRPKWTPPLEFGQDPGDRPAPASVRGTAGPDGPED